jgi:hypothetical protein
MNKRTRPSTKPLWPALGIATVRLELHASEVAVAYAALFRFFRATPVEALVVRDPELTDTGAGLQPSAAAEDRIALAARAIAQATEKG